jgi:hypothetical protein
VRNLSIGLNRYRSRLSKKAEVASSRPGHPLRIAWLIAVAGLLLGLFISGQGSRLDGAAIAMLGLAPLMWVLEKRMFPGLLIGPISIMYLYHLLGYSIGPMWQSHVIGRLNGIEEYMIPAQWGGILGLIVVAIVFPIVFPWAERQFAPRGSAEKAENRDLNWKIYAILLTAVVCFNLGYGFVSGAGNRLGGLSRGSLESSSLFSALNPLQNPLFFFLGYLAGRYHGKWWVFWLVAFSSFTAFYLLEGSRSAVALAGMASSIGFVWAGTSMRKVLLVGLAALVVFIPLAGIILNYRNSVQATGTQLGPRVQVLLETASSFNRSQIGSLADSTEAFARSVTAQAVDRVFLLTSYGVPFVGLQGIEGAIYAFTPQIINPNRPDLNDGNQLAILYGNARPGTTGSYMPTVGDGYRRGGWLGVALLYVWITIIFAGITALCWTRRDRPEWMGMFIFLGFQAAQMWSTTMLSSFYLLLWMIPRSLIVFVVLGWVGRRMAEVHLKMVQRRSINFHGELTN